MSVNPTLPLTSIRLDGGTQARAALDEDTIAAYCEAYKRGDKLPPLVVFDSGASPEAAGPYWLADGFHRYYGAQRAGVECVECITYVGPQRKAWLYSLSANATHGLPRSNADKRRAVASALADSEVGKWAHRKIAKLCAVSHEFVRQVSTVDTQVEDKGAHVGANPTRKGGSSAVGHEKASPAISAGHPTPLSPSPGGNQQEGDERGDAVNDLGPPAASPLDEPAIDMLGLSAGEDWLDTTRIARNIVDRIDQELRSLQAAARALPQPHGQRIHAALTSAAALVRSHRPEIACAICRDPDGSAGKRKGCLSCAGNGWMTAEGKKGLHPAALEPKAVTSKAPRVTVLIETPGGDVPFDDIPSPTDNDYGEAT